MRRARDFPGLLVELPRQTKQTPLGVNLLQESVDVGSSTHRNGELTHSYVSLSGSRVDLVLRQLTHMGIEFDKAMPY